MSRRRCFSANFACGKAGCRSRCLERLPAPTWQPSTGTLKTSPSSVRIESEDSCGFSVGWIRSSKVHWWQTRRSPFCTCRGWYFGQMMYVGAMGLPSGTMHARVRWTLEGVKRQWKGATPVPGTSTMMVFLESEPKHHGSGGRPCRHLRETRRWPSEKKRTKVEAAASPLPSSGGHSTSRSAKASETSEAWLRSERPEANSSSLSSMR
mmetsp:Transcript_80175/g.259664  ORF Transcript_80175/g.259664 Transcript_80175/m.259664 type:complete len:208 (-) Transcript_80175:2307-2930(-)